MSVKRLCDKMKENLTNLNLYEGGRTMKKKNGFKKLLGMAACVCLMTLLFGMTTFAANKVENLALGQTIANTDEDASITHYYRFSVKKSGYLAVSGVAVSGSYTLPLQISLCNAKGKVLDTQSVNATSSVASMQELGFGVNKGTYQLKVQTPYKYTLIAAYKKWDEKSGSTQKKAVALKKKSLKKGVVGIGESAKKVDWYKITLKKPATIQLEFETLSNGYLYATFVPSRSTRTKIKGSYTVYSWNRKVPFTMSGTVSKKLPVGTYYIKVYRGSSDSRINGVYTLKWKA